MKKRCDERKKVGLSSGYRFCAKPKNVSKQDQRDDPDYFIAREKRPWLPSQTVEDLKKA